MSFCFLSLLRLALVLGGMQSYLAERAVEKPCPGAPKIVQAYAPPMHPNQMPPLPHYPVPHCPVPHCTGAYPTTNVLRPAVVASAKPTLLPMPTPVVGPVAETTSVYTVKLRQTGQRDQTVQWPVVVLSCGSAAHCAIESKNNQGWMMSTKVQPGEKPEHVKVQLLLTHLTGEDTPRIYKGTLECKVGADNLTAMREASGTQPLAVSVCVEKAKTTTAPPAVSVTRPAVVTTPSFTQVAPGCYSAMPVLTAPVPARPVPLTPACPAMACPGQGFAFSCATLMPNPMVKTVTLKIEDGVTKLSYRSPEMRTATQELTFDVPGGSVTLKAARGHIAIQGKDFTARATKVEIVGDRLQLTGEVQMSCDSIGPGAELKANGLTVRLNRGGFGELVPMKPMATPMPVMGVRINTPATMPACPGGVCPPDCCPGGLCPKDCCPKDCCPKECPEISCPVGSGPIGSGPTGRVIFSPIGTQLILPNPVPLPSVPQKR